MLLPAVVQTARQSVPYLLTRCSASGAMPIADVVKLPADLPEVVAAAMAFALNGTVSKLLLQSGFDAPLATTVFGSKLYIFLPLGQRERFEYLNNVAHANGASQAAAFTMIAAASCAVKF